MTKKLFLFTMTLIFVLFSGLSFAQEMKAKTGEGNSVQITPDNFPDKAGDMIGKTVEIEGMVVHVCKHGGKKMFIIGDDPDIRVKIDASDKVTVFDPELEGSTVHVTGVVEEMAAEEIPAEEAVDSEDSDHTNYYHKKQYSISCMAFVVVED